MLYDFINGVTYYKKSTQSVDSGTSLNLTYVSPMVIVVNEMAYMADHHACTDASSVQFVYEMALWWTIILLVQILCQFRTQGGYKCKKRTYIQ